VARAEDGGNGGLDDVSRRQNLCERQPGGKKVYRENEEEQTVIKEGPTRAPRHNYAQHEIGPICIKTKPIARGEAAKRERIPILEGRFSRHAF